MFHRRISVRHVFNTERLESMVKMFKSFSSGRTNFLQDRSASDSREVRCLSPLVFMLDVVHEWFSKAFGFWVVGRGRI